MLSQPEVIEVEESVLALLLYANPGKPYRQRLGQYFKRIDASTSNINGSSPYMAARASCLSRLDAMARTAVAAGDGQRQTVMGPQQLQPVHKPLVYMDPPVSLHAISANEKLGQRSAGQFSAV